MFTVTVQAGLHWRYLHCDSTFEECDNRGNGPMSPLHHTNVANSFRTCYTRNVAELIYNTIKVSDNSRHPYGDRPIRITWHRLTNQRSVRRDLHSKWAYEGLPPLHNSGHRATALAIKTQTPKPEVERHTNRQLRFGISSQKLQTLEVRNSITLFGSLDQCFSTARPRPGTPGIDN